jgi:hypothetical protein
MAIFSDIQNILNSALTELQDDGLTVEWENTKIKGQIGRGYIHPQIRSGRSVLRDTSGTQENPGFMQIDVMVPLDKGTKALTDIIDDIYTLFKGQTLTSEEEGNTSQIYIRDITRGPSYRSDSWYVGVVDVYYTCYD